MGIAIELLLELGYMLRMVSIPLDGPALMLGNNLSVVSIVLNTTVPSSVLKKKHLGIVYHRVREAVAAMSQVITFTSITAIWPTQHSSIFLNVNIRKNYWLQGSR